MADIKETSGTQKWTAIQAYTLAVVCLLLGIAGGWLFRGSQSPTPPTESATVAPSAGTATGMNSQPTPEQMSAMADAQAKPLLEKLNSDPNNAQLLGSIGNIYYDTQQYPVAIKYYQQLLNLQPANTSVRTDMATAYWYSGDADTAITEFKKSLSYEPDKANTLFNLGIVEWQGKGDVDAAIAAWQKLLDSNPNYPDKNKVLELIAQAKKHAGVKPGTPAKPLSQ